jgi:hypothetical protein
MTRIGNRRVTCERPAKEKEPLRYIDSPAYDLPADPAARARAISEIAAERRQYPKLAKMHDSQTARMAWIAGLISDRRRRLECPDINLRRHPHLRAVIAGEIRRDEKELAELCDGDGDYLQAWLDYGERKARPAPTLEDVQRGAARYRRYGRAAYAQH